MDKNEVNETLGMQTNVFRQKADKILSAIRVINGQGGLATQFMMVTVCIDVQKFLFFLQEITHSEERDKRLIGIKYPYMKENYKLLSQFTANTEVT